MKIICTPRIIAVFLSFSVVLITLISFSNLDIFPCRSFVSDSTQGYYMSTCAFVDEDGHFLFSKDISGYDPLPTIWTWVMGIFLFIVLPYGLAVWLNHYLNKKSTDKNQLGQS